jgi:hypothetical protein
MRAVATMCFGDFALTLNGQEFPTGWDEEPAIAVRLLFRVKVVASLRTTSR